MAATSSERGWVTVWDGRVWRYADSGGVADGRRACRRCGRVPTVEGHDACLGTVAGLISACCGHGVTEPIARRIQ